ncbi:MAG TPA: plastocyanin/azurin family copper-binding protein [Thermoanaerobaculia bacterium]|nr:plastocyanin/azurin family copper-binding protein [Thermoanaerobaculia bacterium]
MMTPKPSHRSLLLAAAIAALALACGGSSHNSSPTGPEPPTSNPSADVVVVSVFDNHFDPKNVQIKPGQTVRWVLKGSNTNHTVTDSGGAFDSGMTFAHSGDTFEHTFTSDDANKTFNYYCKSHYTCCNMAGSVQVGSSAPPPSPGY